MKKQKIRTLVVGCLLAGSLVVPAFAAETTTQLPPEVTSSTQDVTPTPYAEQFETYYRTVNGVMQYRIWNITKGYWVNDWTYC